MATRANARSLAAKASWTPERRQQQSEIAQRLHAEGRFGGPQPSYGNGGRPKKRSPSGQQLLLVLEAQVLRGGWSWPAAKDVILGRRTFAAIAHLIGIDRDQFEALLESGVRAAIADEQLPEFAIVYPDGSVVLPAPSRHAYVARQLLHKWRHGPDASRVVVIRELSRPDLRRYTDAEIVESLLLLQFVSTRPLLRTAIAVVLADLAGRVHPAAERELARRTDAA